MISRNIFMGEREFFGFPHCEREISQGKSFFKIMKSDPNLNSGFFVKNKNEDNLENLFSHKT